MAGVGEASFDVANRESRPGMASARYEIPGTTALIFLYFRSHSAFRAFGRYSGPSQLGLRHGQATREWSGSSSHEDDIRA